MTKMGLITRLRRRAQGLKAELYALYLAFRDPRTPWYAKALAIAVVAYAVSPIDLIPDFIPVAGYLDDLIILPLGIALAIRMVPRDVMAECRAKAQGRLRLARRATWMTVAAVALIWLVLIALVVFAIVVATRAPGVVRHK